jgi:hypothetical protein
MPTSPVHESQLYEQHHNPYNDSLRGRSRPLDSGRYPGNNVSGIRQPLMRNSTGSDPLVAVSPTSDTDYDYHAAQLAAFLEEYRVLQMELMRMSASLQQVADAEGGGGGGGSPKKAKGANANSSTPVGTNVNAVKIGGPTTAINVSSSQQNSLQQQQQLKSILKNSGNNNNYVA